MSVAELHLALADDEDPIAVAEGRLAAEVRELAAAGATTVRWWVEATTDRDRAVADRAGFTAVRRLHQMRRPLPLDEHTDLVTRPFRPGVDDDAWLAVNNRAFSWHPDQGGWDRSALTQRRAEPWFDADGFLLHEEAGRLLGFCWTKVHTEVDPPLGEIYVIAVDPDATGRGLGRALTLAGLDHLAAAGIGTGMLYVEADNTPALHLYEDLGFTVHHTDTCFERPL